MALHHRLLALHGGAAGLRDRALLQSALARPQQHFSYNEASDILALAAVYTGGIVRNHPFVDGNKRTAITAVGVFLGYNGYRLIIDDLTAYHWLITRYEAGTVKKPAIEQWLRGNVKRL